MSMTQSDTDGTYSEIDLDNLAPPADVPAGKADDIEIVDDTSEPAPEPTPAPASASAPAEDSSEEEDEEEDTSTNKRRLTRSQRLKAQRDAYAAKLAEQEAELTALREKAAKFESSAEEAAGISLDLYIKTIDDSMKLLRQDFDAALSSGDSEKLWEVQTKMMDLAATKKEAEREKRSIPPKAAAKSDSGTEARQPAPTTTPVPTTTPGKTPSKLPAHVTDWLENNKSWFNKDPIMTAAVAVIDKQLVEDGYTIDDPIFMVEFDKRMRAEFPHKFATSTAPQTGRGSPTVQSRAPVAAAGGKVRVVITAEDRAMADHLGIPIEAYAREKAKRERAAATATQYTEIL